MGQLRARRCVPRLEGWFVRASESIDPPLHRRASFEVTGWDGLRWVLEGVFDTGAGRNSRARYLMLNTR